MRIIKKEKGGYVIWQLGYVEEGEDMLDLEALDYGVFDVEDYCNMCGCTYNPETNNLPDYLRDVVDSINWPLGIVVIAHSDYMEYMDRMRG